MSCILTGSSKNLYFISIKLQSFLVAFLTQYVSYLVHFLLSTFLAQYIKFLAVLLHVFNITVFKSRYSERASGPFSLPIPLCPVPPKGTSGAILRC